MLNVFYRDSHLQGRMSGPRKVIQNLIRSLEDTNTSFSINEEKYDNNLFLHWDPHHIQIYQSLKNKDKLLVGPQVWPFSPDINQLTEYGKVIVPSQWVSDLFVNHFDIRTLIWPVAIYAPEVEDNIKTDCLIYYKNRSEDNLLKVTEFFDKKGITYTGLQYGNYTQEEFKESLSEVKYCVIIDNTESQGIAIQEMMAVNKPLFVWDQSVWDHMGQEYAVPATSVPYWSDECGERITSFDQFEETFEIFQSKLNNYTPKDFVDRELSPEATVKILLDYYAS
jgi:hypothetical protein